MKSFVKQTVLFTASTLLVSSALNTIFAQTSTSGQETEGKTNTITTAVPFLLITPDSRCGGMGDAGVALSPDANSIHWNPSKLAFIDKKLGIAISYTPWLRSLVPDINLAYLSVYYKLEKDQTLATSLRYFSLGDIAFTDVTGNPIGQFRPNEFAYDVAYARKFGKRWAGGMSLRYIYSNLTGGITVQGSNTKPGNSIATDISTFYTNDDVKVGGKKSVASWGLNISNIGAKISYSNTSKRDFIPINLKTGGALTMNLDEYNTISFVVDINKLLVPTPPEYATDTNGSPIITPAGAYQISKGKDPNRGVAEGIFGSFSDAPDGFKEEMKEFIYAIGMEYWYDKQFAVRAGYFHEDATKGNRKFFTIGAGLKYNVFGLDFAYLIPTQQRNPLANTLRFTLLFDFDAFKSQNSSPDPPATN